MFKNELDIVEKSFVLIYTFHNVVNSTSFKILFTCKIKAVIKKDKWNKEKKAYKQSQSAL